MIITSSFLHKLRNDSDSKLKLSVSKREDKCFFMLFPFDLQLLIYLTSRTSWFEIKHYQKMRKEIIPI